MSKETYKYSSVILSTRLVSSHFLVPLTPNLYMILKKSKYVVGWMKVPLNWCGEVHRAS
jgi:hypothetical protein